MTAQSPLPKGRALGTRQGQHCVLSINQLLPRGFPGWECHLPGILDEMARAGQGQFSGEEGSCERWQPALRALWRPELGADSLCCTRVSMLGHPGLNPNFTA